MGVSIFNTGYDLQNQLDGVKNGIAIVSTGDTHIAITSGQYVYIQDHGTLAEGLYRATTNIAANGTLSGSNVTAVSGGGLNALNSNLNSLTSISDVKSQLTPATGITINSMIKQEIGRLVIAYMMITTSSAISANTEIVSGMPTPYGTQNYVTTFLAHTALTTELDTYRFSLLDGGKIINLDALPDGKIIRATFTYFKNS